MKKKKLLSTDPSLRDHVRHGKKLIAPLSVRNLPSLKDSSWVVERLPELVWIAELMHGLGDRLSLQVLTEIVRSAHEVWKSGDSGPHFIASAWSSARQEVKNHVRKSLRVNGLLDLTERALLPFQSLYPEYPTQFLIGGQTPFQVEERLIQSFKERFISYFDRFERPALKLHGHIVIAEIKAGLMFLPREMDIPDLNMLYDVSPVNHEDDQMSYVAGFTRSAAMSIFAAFNPQDEFSAARAFWRQGLKLEPCSGRETS